VSDVLVGQGYFLRFDRKLEAAGQPYPPLGALYAAAVLREAGYDVGFFDAMLAGSESEWAEGLDRRRPRLAVLFEDSFNYLTKMCLLRMRQASLTMIAMARARGVSVVISGSDASDHPEVYLGAGAQAVIVGEGEITLREVAEVVTGRSSRVLEDVAGLCLPVVGARPRRTAPRPPLRDLDSLPRPAFDLVDMERYRRIWKSRHGRHSLNLVTTRGCPYHCNWCAKPIYGQRYAVRSPQAVADEMAWVKKAYAPDHVAFMDDIFGLKPGWIEQFAAAVDERDAAIPFKCLTRADLLSEPVVGALRSAGCRTVWIGAESGSQAVLDAMEKGIRVEAVREAAARLRKAGIEVGFFLQFGYPGETWDDVQMTRALVQDCAPDDIGISVSYPLPGTRFFERVRGQLGTKQNWEDSSDLAMMYAGPYPTGFYRALHSLVHTELRQRKLRGAPGLGGWARRLSLAVAAPVHRARLAWWRRRPHRPTAAGGKGLSCEAAGRPSPQEA
jgi:anaerobic magnesium-protoporphyrin IX monomethyl ester cyclase